MDKNTWIGWGCIALILIGFSWYNKPSKEELAHRQHVRDSIAQVEAAKQAALQVQEELTSMSEVEELDSAGMEVLHQQLVAQFGHFAPAAEGEEKVVVLENELVRLHLQTKGGTIGMAELKQYHTYGDTLNDLRLFQGNEKRLNYTLVTAQNRVLSTENMYFEAQPIVRDEDSAQVLVMRLKTDVEDAWLDFVYTLPENEYMFNLKIQAHHLQHILAQNQTSMQMEWEQQLPQQERGRTFEERYSHLTYMFLNRDIEKLSEGKADSERETADIRWIAFKDQFFSTVMIADEGFDGADLSSAPMKGRYIKEYKAATSFAFDPTGEKASSLRIYMGPNKYHTLNAYDKGKQKYERLRLRELVPLGWEIVAWINRIITIPMFDLLTGWGLNIGLVILIMTIVIKLIILPFTFKSFQSSAKMRVLKPQMDEINARIPAEKMQERQQAQFALYQKAGVNPMSGCLPMLFQMPVVMAMFWFFPNSIELRGQSFLWADDLSAYDAIIQWNTHLPFIGDHLSLFTILFTVVNLFYTMVNMQSQAMSNDPSQKMMKWMMYLMPVMFFFVFNDYAAGLSYYYFLSLLISILQTYIFRWTLNDKRVLAQMEKAQAKKAQKPQRKSGFMARLEAMQKEQEKRMREQMKAQAKKNMR